MNVFFAPDLSGERVVLSPDESHHCVRVLRQKEGDAIQLMNGSGTWASGTIEVANKARVSVLITEKELQDKHPYYLHIAIAPTKNMDRFEWFLEKATELGIDEITPILTENSERKKLNMERCAKILLGAAKQNLNAYLPKLNELTPLKQFQTNNLGSYSASLVTYIAENKHTLKDQIDLKGKYKILVGPEGGFTSEEVQEMGCIAVSLGSRRLRTETAGVFVCAALKALHL